MNFNCDVCGREILGFTFVNGMKFCAKCYQETFGETDKDRKIANLEAKLVESEKKILELQEDSIRDNMRYIEELAEKEKEISEYIKIVDDLHKQLSDKCDFCDKTKDQDKISFAVEQLEKVRETAECVLDNALKNSSLNESYYDRLLDEIDNQIKQLREKDNG